MRTKKNERCPLQAECERKCAFAGHELDCDYYGNNAREDFSIPDQEAVREERERRAREEQEEAMLAELPDEDDEARDEVTVAREISIITEEILFYKRQAGGAIIEIGNRLVEAKEMLPHGDWLPWLRDTVKFSERSAQRFMKLAKEYGKSAKLADLGASKALALLTLPEEERDAFMEVPHEVNGEAKQVSDMSVRELEQAIRERDEARRAMEQAQAEARTAQDSRAKMETDMQTLKVRYEQAQAQAAAEKETEGRAAREAEERAEQLQRELEELKAAPVDVAVMAVDQEALDKARAEAVAEVQAKLDRAKEAKIKADEKRKVAEEALSAANARLEELAREAKKAALAADKEMTTFAVLFEQGKETANKMHGILLKLQSRKDQSAAQSVKKAMVALSDAIRGTAG